MFLLLYYFRVFNTFSFQTYLSSLGSHPLSTATLVLMIERTDIGTTAPVFVSYAQCLRTLSSVCLKIANKIFNSFLLSILLTYVLLLTFISIPNFSLFSDFCFFSLKNFVLILIFNIEKHQFSLFINENLIYYRREKTFI